MAIPVLSPEAYIRYTEILGIKQPRIEMHRLGALPQLFADQFGWEEMTAVVADVHNALPPEVRADTAILGRTMAKPARSTCSARNTVCHPLSVDTRVTSCGVRAIMPAPA
jgi:hypothetical protein